MAVTHGGGVGWGGAGQGGAGAGDGQRVEKVWALNSMSFLDFPGSPQLGPGSPPGVWVCSTDMLLSVPPNPGEHAWPGTAFPLPSLSQQPIYKGSRGPTIGVLSLSLPFCRRW